MMKFVFFSLVVALAAADVSHLFKKPTTTFLTPFPTQRQYQRPVVQPVAYQQPHQQYVQPKYQGNVAILKQSQDADPSSGSYNWGYETENGISAQEQASFRSVGGNLSPAVQGGYSYTSPEGEHVAISYVADENGYHATGSHIPTPPPIPAAIARALAWIEAHPYKEVDDTVVIGRRQPVYG